MLTILFWLVVSPIILSVAAWTLSVVFMILGSMVEITIQVIRGK